MQIATYLDNNDEDRRYFSQWKNKAGGAWQFCVVGEWSTMSGTSGNRTYYYRFSDCRKYWALKVVGFPTRIIASALTSGRIRTEKIVGRMVGSVEKAGGEWIDGIFDVSEEFDLNAFWESYSRS